jgi:hypothetical protein
MCLKLLVLPRAQTLESHIHDGSGGAGVSGVHGWGWRARVMKQPFYVVARWTRLVRSPVPVFLTRAEVKLK